MLWSDSRVVLAVFALCLVAVVGCEEQPGETIGGVVNAPAPLVLPMSKAEGCVARLLLTRTHGSGSGKSSTSVTGYHHRWAPGATLTVGADTFELTGTAGRPTYTMTGDEWRWRPGSKAEPPRELWGWGHDSTLDSLNGPPASSATKSLGITEEYTPCGEAISVRAVRSGKTLDLVDTTEVDGENMLTGALGVFFGFFCCMVLPIVLIISFVIRRSLKRESV